MDKFLEKDNLPKLNEEKAENLDREIQAVIKISQHTKALEEIVSQENFTKHLRKS